MENVVSVEEKWGRGDGCGRERRSFLVSSIYIV
jgi:hypothetical protein